MGSCYFTAVPQQHEAVPKEAPVDPALGNHVFVHVGVVRGASNRLERSLVVDAVAAIFGPPPKQNSAQKNNHSTGKNSWFG